MDSSLARRLADAADGLMVVRELPTPPQVRASASLFAAEAERQGLRPGRRMLRVGPEAAEADVAAALRVAPGEDVLARRKLLLAGDVPVRVATSFLRLDLFAGTPLTTPDFVRPSLQAGIESLGHRFGHAEEILIARPPVDAEREALHIDPGEWVVQVLRVAYSKADLPIHALKTVCAASRHIFSISQTTDSDEF